MNNFVLIGLGVLVLFLVMNGSKGSKGSKGSSKSLSTSVSKVFKGNTGFIVLVVGGLLLFMCMNKGLVEGNDGDDGGGDDDCPAGKNCYIQGFSADLDLSLQSLWNGEYIKDKKDLNEYFTTISKQIGKAGCGDNSCKRRIEDCSIKYAVDDAYLKTSVPQGDDAGDWAKWMKNNFTTCDNEFWHMNTKHYTENDKRYNDYHKDPNRDGVDVWEEYLKIVGPQNALSKGEQEKWDVRVAVGDATEKVEKLNVRVATKGVGDDTKKVENQIQSITSTVVGDATNNSIRG